MNNYFHDLAVAFLFAACTMAHLTLRHWPGAPPPNLLRNLKAVAWFALAWIAVGGAIRAWHFQEFEWLPRAGTAQVPALIAKHILLFAITGWGLVSFTRLERRAKQGAA